MGFVGSDSLDGVDEFLDARELLGVRCRSGMETRMYVRGYETQTISLPTEPEVSDHMGIGFAAVQVPQAVATILADLGRRADARNREILARVNADLKPVTVGYEEDVLPLTPAGHPTERHLVLASSGLPNAVFPILVRFGPTSSACRLLRWPRSWPMPRICKH